MFHGYDATSRAVSAVGMGLVLGIVATAAIAIVQTRKQAEHVTHLRAHGQAVSLAAHAKQALISADFVLKTIQREVVSSGVDTDTQLSRRFGTEQEQALLLFREGNFQPVDLIVVSDSTGRLIMDSTRGEVSTINVADREYFQKAKASTSDDLWVSSPVRTRVYGTIDFFLSRRLHTADGRFLGVVAVGLSCEHFSQLYESLRLGHDEREQSNVSSISLLRRDMTLLARAPADGPLLGERLASDGAYAPWAMGEGEGAVGAPARTWDSAAGARNHVEVIAQGVEGLPLMVAVATDRSVYLAGWRRQAAMIGAMAATAVLVFAYSFTALVRVLRRREGYLLENEKLRRVAEDASTAKSQFLATVSHEIRTPMNGILGTAELLARGNLADHEKRLATMLLRSGRSLLGMLDDVLDFSKIEAGELRIVKDSFDVREAVRDLQELFQAFASAKGLGLDIDIDANVPRRLMGDSGRIRQVLVNLLGNAIKFTDTGFVALHVRAARGDRETHLRFEVEDTGVGIPPEAHDRIFDHFAQADSSVVRRFGGTGLGLAISKRLALLMGGELDYVDGESRGTCFHFTIPLVEAQSAEPDALLPESTTEQSGALLPLRPLHVLVTEDNDVNAMVTEAQLASLGCTCDVAVDGEDALAHLAHGRYDVVLMDCMLPGVSGYEASRVWREREIREGRPRMPIIALTANALASNVHQARAAGMDDFLTKPTAIHELRSALERVVAASEESSLKHAD